VVVSVKVWFVAAVPLALNDPLWTVVPALQAVPLAATLTLTVAALPVAVSTFPTMLTSVEFAGIITSSALLGLTPAIHPIVAVLNWATALITPPEAVMVVPSTLARPNNEDDDF